MKRSDLPNLERLTERFWAKVQRGGPDECWPWTGSRGKNGYGSFRLRSDKGANRGVGRSTMASHRLAYLLQHGEIDDSLKILHRCDNPPCTNTNHMHQGTQAENVREREDRCRRIIKLVPEQREEIYRRYRAGGISQSSLAREYGVDASWVSTIVRRREGWVRR